MAALAAKARLLEAGDDGVSVFSHLTDVLASILDAGATPETALKSFEATSLAVKNAQFKPSDGVPKAPVRLPEPPKSTAWHQANSTLLKAGEEEEEGGHVPNVMEEMKFFEGAGVGFSAEESLRLYASLCKLTTAKGLESARLFGKVLGSGADYYVAEVKYAAPPEPEEGAPEPPPDAEEAGAGANAFSYLVSTDPTSGAWDALPNVTPAQIVAAGGIRKMVTGDLAADVRCFPPFPGKEREYLRAMIARVVHDTTLVPAGKYAGEEEDPNSVSLVEEYAPPKPYELLEPAAWATQHMGLLRIGRTTNLPAEEGGDDDDAKPKGPPPEEPRNKLAPLAAAEWGLQLNSGMGGGAAVALARSLKWPGAVAAVVPKEDKCANLYVGYGLPLLAAPFAPAAPPPMSDDADELKEQADTPLADENVAHKAALEEELKNAPEEEEAPAAE